MSDFMDFVTKLYKYNLIICMTYAVSSCSYRAYSEEMQTGCRELFAIVVFRLGAAEQAIKDRNWTDADLSLRLSEDLARNIKNIESMNYKEKIPSEKSFHDLIENWNKKKNIDIDKLSKNLQIMKENIPNYERKCMELR